MSNREHGNRGNRAIRRADPRTRVLSERLRAAASKTIEVDGKPTAGSIVAARLAWEAITKGKVRFPDDAEETILSFDQWLA